MKNKRTLTILLAEDEESLAVGLEYNLNEEGYRVVRAADGVAAVELFRSETIDLVILDLMLPRMDGFRVAEAIRESDPQTPILMLTARTTSDDRIRGLECGADDYLTKPFHLKELLLRVKGMLRRKQWYRERLVSRSRSRIGAWQVDFPTLTVTSGQEIIRMTPLEAMLLRYFVDHAGRIIGRGELLEQVWRTTADVETRTVDAFIGRLRRYFEPEPSSPVYFVNVRGAGYLFQPDGAQTQPPHLPGGRAP